jgi:hypothetical protein
MRRSIFVSAFALALLLLFSAPQLRADGGGSDTFTFTEQVSSSDTLSVVWQLPASPCPQSPVDGVGFGTYDVPTSFFLNGTYAGTTPDLFIFFSNAAGGGFFDGTLSFGLTGTSQVYSGWEDNPTFNVGTYTGFDPINFDSNGMPNSATLTVAAPEPSTLLLLLFGFLAVFGTLTLKKVQA